MIYVSKVYDSSAPDPHQVEHFLRYMDPGLRPNVISPRSLSSGVDDGHRSHQYIDAYVESTGGRIGPARPGPRDGSPSYAYHEPRDPPTQEYPKEHITPAYVSLSQKEKELKEAREEIEKLKREREAWESRLGERECKGGLPEASLMTAPKLDWVPR